MQLSPTFNLSDLDTAVTEFAVVLVGDDGTTMRASGSGVLIGRCLAVTAKHVIEDLWRNLSGNSRAFAGTQPLTADFRILALQFLSSRDDLAVWTVESVWGSGHSDLAILALAPLSLNALSYEFPRQLALRVSAPPEGSIVAAFGFSGSLVEAVSREPNLRLTWGLNPATTQGPVLNVFEVRRGRSLLNFPCFEINARFEGGMSGGPVFNAAGELCGVVCASVAPHEGVSHIAYAATLWPIVGVTINFPLPNLVVNGPYNIADLSRVGYLHLRGWDELVPRITIVRDEAGNEHPVLRDPM